MDGEVSLHLAVWTQRVASVCANTPDLIKNWILRKLVCPNRLCHFNIFILVLTSLHLHHQHMSPWP